MWAYKTSLLACLQSMHVRSMLYMPMHIAHACELCGSLYHCSLFESICLFYKTSSLASNHFQIWGVDGGDDSILWLSFSLLNKNQGGDIRDATKRLIKSWINRADRNVVFFHKGVA
jgi:hypothetical protein